MEVYIKLGAQTAGKDKLARLIQYASKLLAYLVERANFKVDWADQLKHLEFNFGTFRKLLRLGKSIEVLYGTLKTLHLPDVVLRSLLALSKISTALFLVADHIIWLGRVGLVKVQDSERLNRVYNKCWLYSIVLNLLRDLYEIKQSVRHYRVARRPAQLSLPPPRLLAVLPGYLHASLASRYSYLATYCQDHKHIAVDTLKNSCDLFIPLANLGGVRISPGLIGFLGIVSSLAGIAVLLDPSMRMSPS